MAPHNLEENDGCVSAFFGVWAIYALLIVAFWAGVVYVAIHFIGKSPLTIPPVEGGLSASESRDASRRMVPFPLESVSDAATDYDYFVTESEGEATLVARQ
jgi:hypothetical protein